MRITLKKYHFFLAYTITLIGWLLFYIKLNAELCLIISTVPMIVLLISNPKLKQWKD